MAYKIRIVLDVEADVIRNIVIDENDNLENLHFAIAKSFGFKGQEMASFYAANHNWEQGEEIPLCNMSENENALSMQSCTLPHIFKNKGDKLIYVYDFLAMWTFFVEVIDLHTKDNNNLPKITLSIGDTPEQAPEKSFESEENFDDIDAFENEENMENIDDFDF